MARQKSRGRRCRGRWKVARQRGCPPTAQSPPPRRGAYPRPGAQTHAWGARGGGLRGAQTPHDEDAATSRFLPLVATPLVAPGAAARSPLVLSAVPTYVPRVSLNSKIFLMSSACFFQEELLSPFSRAMADAGGARGGTAGRAGPGRAR